MLSISNCLSLVVAAAVPLSVAADTTLWSASEASALEQAAPHHAQVSQVSSPQRGPALRVELGDQSHWPGVSFAFPGGVDASAYGHVFFTLHNTGQTGIGVRCHLESRPRDADGDSPLSVRKRVFLPPGASQEVRIPLEPYVEHGEVTPDTFFGMRGKPYFSRKALHIDNLTRLRLSVRPAQAGCVFEIGDVRLGGEPLPAPQVEIPDPLFPMIDEFGQFKHKDWPGKTHSLTDLIRAGTDELAALEDSPRPASWNRFGGWKDGPQLEATGWFRTAKHQGKWTLVDPEGKLFFSLGIDGVGFRLGTIVNERQHWFDKLPEDNQANSEFYFPWTPELKRSYFYKKPSRSFSFYKYNVMRKYGADWKNRFAETCLKRLPAWGINTLANWSSPDLYKRGKLPYVGYVRPQSRVIEGSTGHWAKFRDVYDPGFEAAIREQLAGEDLAAATTDPMCIGFFVDNELTFGDDTALARSALASPADQPVKKVFVADLQETYTDIAALNRAWGTDHASWDALLAHEGEPDPVAAGDDLLRFNEKFVDAYFSTIKRVLKEIAPNHLYLGCRYGSSAPVPQMVLDANARHADVVSFNVYNRRLAHKLPRLSRGGDKPYMIGEFHYGALDRGMFDTGLVEVADQDERALAFAQFVADCVDHPNIVGCHWFQFNDSPNTGRLWDHENYQIGFTDVCDTPYAELIKASRAAGEALYR